MVGRLDDRLFLVVNAARKETDFALLRTTSGDPGCFEILGDRALIAFQGPKAADVLSTLAPGVEALEFLGLGEFAFAGMPVLVSRSGYTGEDGFEISARAEDAEDIAQRILADERVAPAGLGARDTLRLEAGLCLYGNDIDETTTPVEAGLAFSIGKRRRTEGGFPGDSVILGQLAGGVSRRRVGILPEGRVPARAGTPISDAAGTPVGTVTSGGFAPSIDGPAAMGYVEMDQAEEGTELHLTVRGKDLAARVVKLPFVAHRYYKG
jgi:aminomethyltransferase